MMQLFQQTLARNQYEFLSVPLTSAHIYKQQRKTMNLTQRLIDFLTEHHVEFQVKHHEPTPTSEEAAKARREPLKIGAKALLVKGDETFVILVLPADRKLDTKKAKKALNTRNLRFATPEELKRIASVEKGALPPFGSLLGIGMIADPHLFEEEFMAFNAGSREISVKMRTKDYKRIINPRVEDVAEG